MLAQLATKKQRSEPSTRSSLLAMLSSPTPIPSATSGTRGHHATTELFESRLRLVHRSAHSLHHLVVPRVDGSVVGGHVWAIPTARITSAVAMRSAPDRVSRAPMEPRPASPTPRCRKNPPDCARIPASRMAPTIHCVVSEKSVLVSRYRK